jgi:hypothetical protein
LTRVSDFSCPWDLRITVFARDLPVGASRAASAALPDAPNWPALSSASDFDTASAELETMASALVERSTVVQPRGAERDARCRDGLTAFFLALETFAGRFLAMASILEVNECGMECYQPRPKQVNSRKIFISLATSSGSVTPGCGVPRRYVVFAESNASAGRFPPKILDQNA